MKIHLNISLIFFVLILGSLAGCAGKPGDIRFEQEFYELGELDEGIKTEVDFIFTNTGDGLLVINDVKPSCSCTVPHDWDKTVKPGAIGKIPVTFNTTGYRGDIVRLIDVTTNVPEKPLIQLTLKAKIKTPVVELTPTKIWLAEISPELKQLVGTFRVKSNLDTPFKILEVVPPDLKHTYNLTQNEADGSYKFDFTVYPPFNGKGNVEKAFILKTNLAEKPEVTLPFLYYKP